MYHPIGPGLGEGGSSAPAVVVTFWTLILLGAPSSARDRPAGTADYCVRWRVAVMDRVRVVFCPVQPVLTTTAAELRRIEQIGKDVAVIRARPGGT